MKSKIREDGEGGATPSNAMNTGQVDITPTRNLNDLHRRAQKQRKQMDEYFINMFHDIMVKGK